VAPVAVREDTEPAYLRFPVIARDREAREGMAAALARCGLPYVRSYPTTLGGIAAFRPWCEERPTPRADALADRLLALPCHAGVPAARVRRAVAVLGGTREPRGERAAGANTLVSSGI
jgi:dTDP-4-amino-4,6-dideoxygalactose transaminase